MPIIKSAKKRVRVTEKRSIQNSKTKRSLRQAIKSLQTAIASKKDTTKAQAEVYSAIDTAVKKGIISKNRAARKKSQVKAATKAAGTSKVGSKKAKSTAKPAAKKPVAKKSTPKKVSKK